MSYLPNKNGRRPYNNRYNSSSQQQQPRPKPITYNLNTAPVPVYSAKGVINPAFKKFINDLLPGVINDPSEIIHYAQAFIPYTVYSPKRESETSRQAEFLGDAVLNLCVTSWLHRKFPREDTRRLDFRRRILIANQKGCLVMAEALGLGRFLPPSEPGSKVIPSAFEALLGTMFERINFHYVDVFMSQLLDTHGPELFEKHLHFLEKHILEEETKRDERFFSSKEYFDTILAPLLENGSLKCSYKEDKRGNRVYHIVEARMKGYIARARDSNVREAQIKACKSLLNKLAVMESGDGDGDGLGDDRDEWPENSESAASADAEDSFDVSDEVSDANSAPHNTPMSPKNVQDFTDTPLVDFSSSSSPSQALESPPLPPLPQENDNTSYNDPLIASFLDDDVPPPRKDQHTNNSPAKKDAFDSLFDPFEVNTRSSTREPILTSPLVPVPIHSSPPPSLPVSPSSSSRLPSSLISDLITTVKDYPTLLRQLIARHKARTWYSSSETGFGMEYNWAPQRRQARVKVRFFTEDGEAVEIVEIADGTTKEEAVGKVAKNAVERLCGIKI